GGPVLSPWSVTGTIFQEHLGQSVAGRGDVNGDGFTDMLIGAPDFGGETGLEKGRALLYLGNQDGSQSLAWYHDGATNDRLGVSVAFAGDLDADGYSDVAVGVFPFSGNGRVEVFFGGQFGLDPNPDWVLSPTPPEKSFYKVAAAGDWNGDGYGDLLVAA